MIRYYLPNAPGTRETDNLYRNAANDGQLDFARVFHSRFNDPPHRTTPESKTKRRNQLPIISIDCWHNFR